jgi:DNA helicase-2/ATP-dependent DNA helicase PcrA
MDAGLALSDLSSSQRRAVTTEASLLSILAGPGSGKTRVLTRRIAWGILTDRFPAGRVVAVTFTRKAADEMRNRLRNLGVRGAVEVGTFHSLGYALLRRYWADRSLPPRKLTERKGPIVARLLRPRGKEAKLYQGALVADLVAEIEWAKARLLEPGAYVEAASRFGRRPPLPPSEVASLYASYEDLKRRQGIMDLDDLVLEASRVMEADPDFAAAQRWLRRHFFVDEFQDLNPAQWRLLRSWMGQDATLTAVGDPNQSIYSWNGADPQIFDRLMGEFPATQVVELEENFRSTPEILYVALAALAPNYRPGRPRPRSDSRADLPLWQRAIPRPTRAGGPSPTITSYEDDRSEAEGIATRANKLHAEGRPWAHMAVLARTNSQLALLAEQLVRLGVPCRVTESASLLAQPEIAKVLDTMELEWGSRPPESWASYLEELAEEASGDDRRAHLEALARLAGDYAAAEPNGDVSGFRGWLRTATGEAAGGPRSDALELVTFHRAKGLEWEVVFLAGLEAGFVPIAQAQGNEAAEAEERRLLYVAATRARDELHCSWAGLRKFGTRQLTRRPSPYLEAMQKMAEALARPPLGREASLRRLRSARRRLDAAGRPLRRPLAGPGTGADQSVLGQLRSWRAKAARYSGVPAHVIFHDATLAAIARRKPRTIEELLSVPGIGPVKASRWGQEVLEAIAEAEGT